MTAVLTIDLAALTANWRFLADKIGTAECSAVVKADAYGCGMEPVARALQKAGCKTFFVAHLSEAKALRKIINEAVIYVLNGFQSGETSDFSAHDVRPVISDTDALAEWLHHTNGYPYALQIDSGMNRLGIKCNQLPALDACKPALIMSHFVSSEAHDDPRNQTQIKLFDEARAQFPDAQASLANSSGIFLKDMPYYDLVRPGYALYGGNPTPDAPNPMQNVVSLNAPVIQLARVQRGETVGYNGIWKAQRDSIIATLAIGYADGFHRAGGSTKGDDAQIAWNDQLLPVVGRISMDLITVDVTDAKERPQRGNMLEIIGTKLPIDAVAARMKTIGYEVLTSLGKRFERHYI